MVLRGGAVSYERGTPVSGRLSQGVLHDNDKEYDKANRCYEQYLQARSLSHSLSLSLSFSLSLSLALSLPLSLDIDIDIDLSLSRSLALSLALSHLLTRALALSLSLSLSEQYLQASSQPLTTQRATKRFDHP